MTRTAALPLAVLIALAGSVPGASAQTTAPAPAAPAAATSATPPDARLEAVETRMDTLDAKLDQLLGALKASKAGSPAPASTAGAPPPASGPAIAPASVTETGTAATQLKPGWVVRTFLLAPRFLEKTGDVLSAFVLPESTFHLNDHVPHSLFPKSTKVAYELTGFLDVKEPGEHSLGLLIDEGGAGTCAARASIENQVVFEDDSINGADKAFDPLIGIAKLDVGLYEVRIWIGCSNPGSKPLRVRIIARSPSMSAPDVLPASSIGHKEL